VAEGPEAAGVAPVDRLAAVSEGLRAAVRRFGTPCHVTDVAAISAAAAELRSAFPDPWLRQYSVKANDVPAIIGRVASHGLGANVVSRGEWSQARRAGLPNDRISLEGVGKTDADLAAAVRAARDGAPLLWLAAESVEEIAELAKRARAAGLGGPGRPALDVLFRLNPDVNPETHASLAVGAGGSKFGMTETELSAAVELAADDGRRSLRPRGIHLHVGSQLGAVDAWRDAVRRGLALLGLLRGSIDAFDTLDVGGGFPVAALDGSAPRPHHFARELPGLLETIPPERRPRRLAVEPGRFLVGRAGWLVARVLHGRDRGGPQVVLDAGMTELIRPALYGAHHPIVALETGGEPVPTHVHGPICESTDALGEHDLPPLRRGDLVAIADTGAYAASLGSAYNGRPRPPQVLLEPDGRLTLARRRGTIASLA
jgi:diaminopimelate decarboxylase